MSTIPLLLMAWLIQAVAAAVLVTPIAFFARRRVHWYRWELLSLVIPFCIWWLLCLSSNSKSLANLIIEPGVLGLALGLGALVRVGITRHIPEQRAALAALFGMCGVAAAIFWGIPGLEE
jgi:hypothetical protein